MNHKNNSLGRQKKLNQIFFNQEADYQTTGLQPADKMSTIKMTRTLKKVEDNDNGVKCDQCGTTSCKEDKAYPSRLLWTSNLDDSKNICRMCVGINDTADEYTLEERIAYYINGCDGGCATAREMAKAFGITKTEVNQVLYSNKKFINCGERGKAPLWETTD